MRRWPVIFLVLTGFSLIGCGSTKERSVLKKEQSGKNKGETYQQGFTTPVALFVRERNGAPRIMASAFLVDKERGLFASAKHFVGNESDGDCKIFFNEKVYKGFLVKVPLITDLVIIKIEGDFDSAHFPEPYRVASGVKKGDKVFIRGIHTHSKKFQENRRVIPIISQYYGMIGLNNEFVFDNLEARVVDLTSGIKNKNIKGMSELLSGVTNIYFKLETKEDHGFSFGGLSGGPTVNEREELVGINSVEREAYLEINEKGLTYHPWVTLNLVPAEELKKLMAQVSEIK